MIDTTMERVPVQHTYGNNTHSDDAPIDSTLLSTLPSTLLFEESDVFVNGINMHYGRWFNQRNDATNNTATVLCIHGLTANHRCWGTIAATLVDAGLNVIAMDLRGRGLSSKPQKGYGIFNHVNDVIAFMDEIGLAKPVVIGHSLGAMIALNFAAAHPERLSHVIAMDSGAPPTLAQLLKVMVVLRPSLARLNATFKSPERYVELIRSSPFMTTWNKTIEDHALYEIEEVGGRWRTSVPMYVIDQEFQSFGGAVDPFVAITNAIFNPIGYLVKAWPSRYFPYGKITVPVLALRAPGRNREDGDQFLTEDGLVEMKKQIRDFTGLTVPNTNHYTIVFAEHAERDRMMLDFLTRD
jgi:pimeloyl-ACP methyl ester carboxylesterase